MRPASTSSHGQRVATIVLAALAAGCTMGPDYKRPEITPPPDQFRSMQQMTSADAKSFADLAWWQVFNDPALQSLVNEALTHSYDIQIAVSRIEQARAALGVTKSEALPQVGYGAFAGAEKTVTPQQDRIDVTRFNAASAGLNAAWEIDIWGRIRRTTEAAEANLLAQEEVRRGVMLTLVSDVATGYFRLISLDRELAIAQESQNAFRDTHDLFTLRYQSGRDSALPAERAKASLDASTAAVADLQRQIAQQENALSILVGGYPHAIQRGAPLTAMVVPPQVPVGLTTDLLRRRPDIRQAEQSMIGANAQIGAAVANFYPRIGLSAVVGFIGVNSDTTGIDGHFNFWRAGAALSGPLFTGGRLQSVYDERRAFWDGAVATYKKTVLTAFRETSDALVAQQTLVDRRAALETQVAALRNAVDIALTRYRGGRSTYFEVLEAQQQLFPAEDQLAQAQQAQLVAVVNLYKALGGGWQLKDDQWAKPG